MAAALCDGADLRRGAAGTRPPRARFAVQERQNSRHRHPEHRQSASDVGICAATISFGQAMPEDAMRRATELAQHCDLFIAIGSSLVVWPAAGFPMLAKNCGARLVIINNEPTEQDDIADLVIRHDIGETLGPFVGN